MPRTKYLPRSRKKKRGMTTVKRAADGRRVEESGKVVRADKPKCLKGELDCARIKMSVFYLLAHVGASARMGHFICAMDEWYSDNLI